MTNEARLALYKLSEGEEEDDLKEDQLTEERLRTHGEANAPGEQPVMQEPGKPDSSTTRRLNKELLQMQAELRAAEEATVKARVAVIENELAESEICAQLVETMKEKNEKVRRKAIAALGEYMFYAAT